MSRTRRVRARKDDPTDERAWFEPHVRTFARPALKFACMMVHDIEIAQEMVQEAFTRVWAAPTTPSAEIEFRRFLYRTITNLARDYYRHRARQYRAPVEMPIVLDPVDAVERRASDEAMRGAMRALTLRERQAIYLRYFEDQSFAETARLMGAPQVTVRVIVHRALAKLRRHLTASNVTGKVAI